MTVVALAYHPTVAHYLRYVATTVGRDKLLRALQYFSRFYAWYLLRTNRPSKLIASLNAIKTQFGMVRKALRLGKNVEHFKAAAVASDTKGGDAVLKYSTVGRQLGYGIYLTLDAAAYLDAAGIKTIKNAKRLQKEASRAWLAGLTFSAMAGLYSLWQLKQRAQAIDIKEGEGMLAQKSITKERDAVQLQLVSDLCDLTIPSTALGYTDFDDGIVGIAGTMSSLIGIYGTWLKTA